MARIRSYELDENLSANDYLLGNDGDNGNIITKRFALPDLRTFILQGSGVDIVRTTPRGFIPAVSRFTDTEGNFTTERSGIRVLHEQNVSAATDPGLGMFVNPADTTIGFTAQLSFTGNGVGKLILTGYNNKYYLPDFVGQTFTFTLLSDTTQYQATIMSYDGFVNVTDRDATTTGLQSNYYDYEDTFTLTGVTAPVGAIENINSLSFLSGTVVTLDIAANVSLGALEAENINASGNLVVQGTTGLVGNVTASSDIELTGGNLLIDSDSSGILFGDPSPHMTLTTDGTNLQINSDPTSGPMEPTLQVNAPSCHNDNVKVQDSSFRVLSTTDADNEIRISNSGIIQEKGGVDFNIEAVIGNPIAPPPGAPRTLQSIQVGDILYTLPDPQADVASVVPGITQTLAPSSAAGTTVRWWYGTNQGTTATFENNVNYTVVAPPEDQTLVGRTITDLAPLVVTSGETSLQFANSGAVETYNVTADDGSGGTETLNVSAADFDYIISNVFDDIPPFQRLFFALDATGFPAASGGTFSGESYQVAGLFENRPAAGQATVTFSRLGAGTVLFSAESIRINPLPSSNASANNAFLFIDQDDNNRLVSSTVESIAGVQSIVNYEITETPDDPNPTGTLLSINFDDVDGNPHITNNGGALTVDISGRLPLGNATALGAGDIAPLRAGHSYILGALPTATTIGNRTLNLPQGSLLEAGDMIKVYNLSDLDTNGNVVESATWRIQVHNFGIGGTDRIMRLPASDSFLDLDVIQTMTFVWSGIATVGWIVE